MLNQCQNHSNDVIVVYHGFDCPMCALEAKFEEMETANIAFKEEIASLKNIQKFRNEMKTLLQTTERESLNP